MLLLLAGRCNVKLDSDPETGTHTRLLGLAVPAGGRHAGGPATAVAAPA
jgi:hypothetical protein